MCVKMPNGRCGFFFKPLLPIHLLLFFVSRFNPTSCSSDHAWEHFEEESDQPRGWGGGGSDSSPLFTLKQPRFVFGLNKATLLWRRSSEGHVAIVLIVICAASVSNRSFP